MLDGPVPSPPSEAGAPDTGGGPPGQWVRPVSGPMTSGFGPRWGRLHAGVDFGARDSATLGGLLYADRTKARVPESEWAAHVRAMLAFAASGSVTFDYGNNIRQVALEAGVANAFMPHSWVLAYADGRWRS